MIKYRKYLLKLKDAFLEENVQNTKMLDLYLKYLEGEASEQDLEDANKQLAEILKSLGMGVLVVLPFSPVSIPYLVKKAKENNIDIVPKWYKALREPVSYTHLTLPTILLV